MKKNRSGAIKGNFKNKSILSLDQFDTYSIMKVINRAEKIRKMTISNMSKLLKGKVVTLLFYEPSSRTFSSFAVSTKRLGGQTIEYQNPFQTSSAVKGETLEDTIKVFENYCNAIVIRHPEIGAAQRAADTAIKIPILNAGDGGGEHPTQALLDMYTIYRKFGRLDKLVGLISGDFRYARALRSLLKGLAKYKNNTLYLFSPKELSLTREDYKIYLDRGLNIIEIQKESQIPNNCNFWYWTRVQKERFKNPQEAKQIKIPTLTTKLLKQKGNNKMIIMHVLPRIDEVDVDVDEDPRAIYFNEQLQNGVYTRMALLALVLGKI